LEVIAVIDGSGSINYVKDYEAVDKTPYLNTVSYYRLSQTDYDGTTTQSGLVAVHTKTIDDVLLSPNPVNDYTSLTFTSKIAGNVVLKMYDMTGKLVKNHSIPLKEGANQLPINLRSLSNGIYMLMIQDSDNQILEQIKVLKN
jgi:hypothetical protein